MATKEVTGTKQEEIRERIEGIITDSIKRHNTGGLFAPRTITQEILTGLHSQGVVLKVDRVLPEFYTSKMPTAVCMVNKYSELPPNIECGFYEPLIES